MKSIRGMLSGFSGRVTSAPARSQPQLVEPSHLTTMEEKTVGPEEQTEDTLVAAPSEQPADGVGGGDESADDDDDRVPRIKGIQIEGIIGSGGMGVVYLGYHEGLDRKVAIKTLNECANRVKNAERLRREAKALAKLRHTNIVTVHDIKEDKRGVHFVMEYIDGPTLREWRERAPRKVSEVIDVFLGAAAGLVAAHEAGLAHRDFKPDNVLIDEHGNPRVVDFGLALQGGDPVLDIPREIDLLLASGRDFGHQEDLTQTGTMLGTPGYMAAEQWAGQRGDPRSDQFAFCVALFEALYGRRPFQCRSVTEQPRLVLAGAFSFPDRPVAKGRVTRRLKRLLTRGLARDPSNRFPSMAALFAELSKTSKPVRRWRATVIITLSAVSVVTAISWKVINDERWRVYQDTCLQPARVAYLRGDLGYAREILGKQTCLDRAPRGASVQASVHALEVMNAVIYGADAEVLLSAVTKRRSTVDALDAEVFEGLWRLRSANPRANHDELLRLLDAKRAEIGALIEEASRQEQSSAAAPYAHLVAEALLVRRPDVGLEARIDAAIAALEVTADESPFLLSFARQSLEPDHREAIATIERVLDRTEDSDEVAQLLRAEIVFRTSLLLLDSPDDAALRAEAKELLAQTPMPGNFLLQAHLNLAHVAIESPTDGSSTQLEAVRAAASRLWWDVRLWEGLAKVEARVAEASRLEQFAAEVEELVAQVEGPEPNCVVLLAKLSDLVTRSRELDVSPEHHDWLEWARVVCMLNMGLEQGDTKQLRHVIETARAVELAQLKPTYVQRVQTLILQNEERLETLEAATAQPQHVNPRPKPPRTATLQLVSELEYGATFEIGGAGKLKKTITRPHSEPLPIGELTIQCGGPGLTLSGPRRFQLGSEGLKVACTESGPQAR